MFDFNLSFYEIRPSNTESRRSTGTDYDRLHLLLGRIRIELIPRVVSKRGKEHFKTSALSVLILEMVANLPSMENNRVQAADV